jgi:hypothetical protein
MLNTIEKMQTRLVELVQSATASRRKRESLDRAESKG